MYRRLLSALVLLGLLVTAGCLGAVAPSEGNPEPDPVRYDLPGTACEVVAVEPGDDSHTVTVECGHWYEFAEGETYGIADGAPYAIVYTVTEDGQVSHGEAEPAF